MLPEVEFVYNQRDGLPVRLDDVARRIDKPKSLIHQNLQTAVRRGILYQPERGWYAKRKTSEILRFAKPYGDYVQTYLKTEDPSELLEIINVIGIQAKYMQDLITRKTMGQSYQLDFVDEYLVPNRRSRNKKKKVADEDE